MTKKQLDFTFIQVCQDLSDAYLLRKRLGSSPHTRDLLRSAITNYRKTFKQIKENKKCLNDKVN